jgi:hypothetical protein
MYLGANGTQFVTLRNGNVGIGTTLPTAKLQINSTSAGAATVAAFLVNESVTTNTEVRLAFAANTNNDIATDRYSYISAINTSASNGQALKFATNETGAAAVERMRITAAGNVGIGTTSMDTKLHVFNGSAGTISSYESVGITIENSGRGSLQFLTPANSDAYVFFGAPHTSGITANRGYIGYDHASDIMLFFSSGKYSFTSGNVGVGTTNATNRLDIQVANKSTLLSTVSGINVNYTGATTGQFQTIGFSWDSSVGTRDSYWGMGFTGTNYSSGLGDLFFFTGGGERARITSGGSVCIGTTSSSYRLAVVTSSSAGLYIQTTGSTFGSPSIAMLNGATDTTISATSNGLEITTYSTHDMLFRTALTERMRITSAGLIGIGTTSPSNYLTIGQNTAGDETAYSLAVLRSGTTSSPGTWKSTPAISIMDISGDGPSSVSNTNALLQLSLPRVGDIDTFANNAFFINCVNDNGSAFVVTGKRNVGIGTNAPLSPLHIQTAEPTLRIVDSDDSGVMFIGNSGGYSYIRPFSRDFRFLNAAGSSLMAIASGGKVGIQNTSPQGLLEVGVVSTNSTYGGHFFSTFTIPVNTWTTVFTAPNNTWAAITEFTWTSAADFNRSGAAYMRWAYEAGGATLGVVYTLFNNSQNSTATFRNNGGQIQVNITGGAANYYVQVRIQGSQAA